jgi:hypothetical protein
MPAGFTVVVRRAQRGAVEITGLLLGLVVGLEDVGIVVPQGVGLESVGAEGMEAVVVEEGVVQEEEDVEEAVVVAAEVSDSFLILNEIPNEVF